MSAVAHRHGEAGPPARDRQRIDRADWLVIEVGRRLAEPSYFGEVKSDVLSAGRHLLIEGPSGIGKTCVAYKIFEEWGWAEGTDYAFISCQDEHAEARIDAFFAAASSQTPPDPRVLMLDDFHLLSKERRSEIGAALKRLSDRTFEQANPPR